jgi:SET domain-containing protein
VARSPIHRFGVFALQAIPAGRKVIEYAGQRISAREWRRRTRLRPSADSRAPILYFSLNRHWGVDAAVGGNGAELINHGCDPNLHTRKIRGHIFYFSRRRIHPGEELTVDYRFRWRARRDPCHCGSPKCRGTINLPAPKQKAVLR